jgi:hypothetical protein
VPLFGATGASPVLESFIIVGFDFGPGSLQGETEVPAPMRSK